MKGRALAAALAALVSIPMSLGLGCGKSGERQGGSEQTSPDPKTASGSEKDPAADKKEEDKGPPIPDRGDEHSVYSLHDNRLSAHPQRAGGLVVRGGSAGFPRYMRFGRSRLNWNIREKQGDVPVARMSGKSGRLVVPLSTEQAAGDVQVRFKIHSDAEQRLGLRIQGKRDKEVTIPIESSGWSVIETTVPKGVFEAGENEVLMFASSRPLDFEWMVFGGQSKGEDMPTMIGKDAFELAEGDGLAYYVFIPEKGRLVADVTPADCAAKVVATDSSGKKVSGELRGANAAVELGELAGKAARLDVVSGCEKMTLTRASLMVPGKRPELERGDAPKHIVFLIIDSLRADRVKPFNDKARPEVPVLEDLAKKASFFTQAYVQGNESRASHASMWTSTYPVVHRMIPGGNPGSIDEKWFTIDELIKKQGFYTFGVSANGYVTPRRGFGTAWDKYRNHIHDGGGLTAERLLTKVWEILSGKEKDKWFGYIGFIDTHVSWRAKEPWLSRYMDKGYSGSFKRVASGVEIEKIATGKRKISDADKEQISALYDSNVSYQDQKIGEMLAKLEELGIADDTMLIVTADHGDELFEDGRVGHGASLRDSLVHVPLIIHYPKLFPGKKIPEGADTVDIVPTIADVFGVPMHEDWQGESLLPLAQGVEGGYPRLSFASKYEDVHVGRMKHWKLRMPGAGTPALFDLQSDPLEMKDASSERPMEMRVLTDASWLLRAYNADWRKWKWGNPANVKAEFPAHFGE